MVNTPTVSVIMAAKDEGKYINACIQSIRAQSYNNWELIVVDDHSKDKTAQIIHNNAKVDSRIKYVLNDGQRLNDALQTAQKHINGELINRMDADDLMPEYKLKTMVEKWNEFGPGHIVAGGTQHFVENGEVGDGFLRYDAWLNEVAKNSSHWQEIYRECVIPSHCWLIHKSDFLKVGGFATVYPEDYDLCFRFYQSKLRVISVNRVFHFWRDTQNRISRTWDEYKDNRFFELKTKYFFDIDFDKSKTLIIWGAGKNGKDLVKLFKPRVDKLIWLSNNPKKIGKEIYNIKIDDEANLSKHQNAQLIIAVSNPAERFEIRTRLAQSSFIEGASYWFFL